MAVDYTTAALLKSVKKRGSLPSSQQLFSDTSLLELASDELDSLIVPHMLSVREEYFTTYTDVAVAASSTPSEVNIPTQAIGQKLREVAWVNSNGHLINVPQIVLEQGASVAGLYSQNYLNSGFIIQGNKLILYPSNQGTGTLRLYYYGRPLQLELKSNAGQVTAINTGTNELTLTFIPSSWSVGDTINSVNQNQPFETTLTSGTIVTSSSPILELDDVTGINVGDWITLEGYSVIPQIPIELHKSLAQAVTVKVLESLNDDSGFKKAQAKLTEMLKSALVMLTPRVDGQPKKITGNGNTILDWGTNSIYGNNSRG